MMQRLDICNALRRETERVPDMGIPLDCLPQKMQRTILDLAHYENYNIEYTTACMLSATATAIGNTCHVLIKGTWQSSPALFMMLVGRPGTGKTPPLMFAYRPLRKQDEERLYQYQRDLDIYLSSIGSADVNDMKRPKYQKTVISDTTIEGLIQQHGNNPRGVACVVDEIIGLFKSVERYGKGSNLIETFLSAYSGEAIDVIRKTDPRPVYIKRPCINIIGSVQTGLLSRICSPDNLTNGLIDRFLFVYPKNQKISLWESGSISDWKTDFHEDWQAVIDKILVTECAFDEKTSTVVPQVLKMSDEARQYFFEWVNGIITQINAIEDDAMVETRSAKLSIQAARLALIIQILRWAYGESHREFIDVESARSAIKFVEYFEDCYTRVQDAVVEDEVGEQRDVWLSLLPGQFSTNEAIEKGKKAGIPTRTVHRILKQLCSGKHPKLEKVKHGIYHKLPQNTSVAVGTLAVWHNQTQNDEGNCQNAKLQSAKGNFIGSIGGGKV